MRSLILLLLLFLIPIMVQAEITGCQCVKYETVWVEEAYNTYQEAVEAFEALEDEEFCDDSKCEFLYEARITIPLQWIAQIIYTKKDRILEYVFDIDSGTVVPAESISIDKWILFYPKSKCVRCEPFE